MKEAVRKLETDYEVVVEDESPTVQTNEGSSSTDGETGMGSSLSTEIRDALMKDLELDATPGASSIHALEGEEMLPAELRITNLPDSQPAEVNNQKGEKEKVKEKEKEFEEEEEEEGDELWNSSFQAQVANVQQVNRRESSIERKIQVYSELSSLTSDFIHNACSYGIVYLT